MWDVECRGSAVGSRGCDRILGYRCPTPGPRLPTYPLFPYITFRIAVQYVRNRYAAASTTSPASV